MNNQAASNSAAVVADTTGIKTAIYGRRAVRSFEQEPLGRATIQELLKAAVHAPTAVHEEPWAFVVVQDKTILKRLSDSAKKFREEMERSVHVPGPQTSAHFVPPENIFYDAGTLIVIYGKPMGPFVVADCWLAAENLMLAAYAAGLGTCVIGLAVPALNSAEWKTAFGVPVEMTAYAPIIVGVPRGEAPPTPRQDPRVLCWK